MPTVFKRNPIMGIGWDNWAVLSVPFVIIGAGLVYYLLTKHKEKPPTDHILKL